MGEDDARSSRSGPELGSLAAELEAIQAELPERDPARWASMTDIDGRLLVPRLRALSRIAVELDRPIQFQ